VERRPQLLGGLPRDVDLVVSFVRGDRSGEASPLPVGETFQRCGVLHGPGERIRFCPVPVWLLTVVAHMFPVTYVVFLFVGRGRTPYDLISSTEVIQEVQTAPSI